MQERLNDKIDSFALGIVSGPVALLLVTGLMIPLQKSVRSIFILYATLTAIWLGWFVLKGRKLQEEIRTTRLGYLGEVLVGQELERTRAKGCFVFHDIINDKPKFNIDHGAYRRSRRDGFRDES